MLKHSILSILLVCMGQAHVWAQHFVDIDAGLHGVGESSSRWIDAERDGDVDALVMGEFFRGQTHGIRTSLYRNMRNDHFQRTESGLPDIHRGDIDFGDYNLNGIQDAAIVGELKTGQKIAAIYRGLGNGRFSPTGIQFTPVRDGSIMFGDFDNDGDPDILITGESEQGPVSIIYRNDRNDRFTALNAGLTGITRGMAVWFDHNLNGQLDVFVTGATADGQPFSMLYEQENGRFKAVHTGIIPLKNSHVAIGDYDNDGDFDLVIMGERQDGRILTRLYRNDRNGTFTQVAAPFVGVRHGFLDWGDFDDDGDLDLLLSGESAQGPVTKVYRNDRESGFTEINAGLIGLYMSDGQWGDFDLDGDLDILISGLSADYQYISRIYRNDGTYSDAPAKVADEAEIMYADIWATSVVVPERPKHRYYYLYSSTFSDLHNSENKDYYVFVSPVKKPTQAYELEDRFNPIIRQRYPNWAQIDQGNIVTNGFASLSEAERSRDRIIHEYQRRGFRVIEINW